MDDLEYGDIGCFEQNKIKTPHVDRLCNEGVKLTQHYSGSPVSAPVRYILITGIYSGRAQIRFNNRLAEHEAVDSCDSMYVHKELEGQFPLQVDTMAIGRMIQQAGYTVGCFGKWGLGYSDPEGTPNKQGFDRSYGHNCQCQSHTYYPPLLCNDEEHIYLSSRVTSPHRSPLDKGTDPDDPTNYVGYTQKEYASDLIFDKPMGFVNANKRKPFFLMWTTPLPYVSLQAPERWVQHYVEKFGDEKPYTRQAGYLPCQYPHATYTVTISYFDEQIGRLIEKSRAEHLYESTLIVFTSDNGPSLNGNNDSPQFNSGGSFNPAYGQGKCSLHEGGIRVPAIITWPGKIKPGMQSDHICTPQDVMFTLAEPVDIICPPTNGVGFLPTLPGKKGNKKSTLICIRNALTQRLATK